MCDAVASDLASDKVAGANGVRLYLTSIASRSVNLVSHFSIDAICIELILTQLALKTMYLASTMSVANNVQ